jgi:SNF2 family DNA or RNA helicase
LLCAALGKDALRYDGAVGESDREAAKRAFQDPAGPRYFVGNPAVGGEGLTLHAATTVVYHSNSFNYSQRLQSEDRAHRIGQTKPVTYLDVVAEGTVDNHIVDKLRSKMDIACAITGDEVRKWL